MAEMKKYNPQITMNLTCVPQENCSLMRMKNREEVPIQEERMLISDRNKKSSAVRKLADDVDYLNDKNNVEKPKIFNFEEYLRSIYSEFCENKYLPQSKKLANVNFMRLWIDKAGNRTVSYKEDMTLLKFSSLMMVFGDKWGDLYESYLSDPDSGIKMWSTTLKEGEKVLPPLCTWSSLQFFVLYLYWVSFKRIDSPEHSRILLEKRIKAYEAVSGEKIKIEKEIDEKCFRLMRELFTAAPKFRKFIFLYILKYKSEPICEYFYPLLEYAEMKQLKAAYDFIMSPIITKAHIHHIIFPQMKRLYVLWNEKSHNNDMFPYEKILNPSGTEFISRNFEDLISASIAHHRYYSKTYLNMKCKIPVETYVDLVKVKIFTTTCAKPSGDNLPFWIPETFKKREQENEFVTMLKNLMKTNNQKL